MFKSTLWRHCIATFQHLGMYVQSAKKVQNAKVHTVLPGLVKQLSAPWDNVTPLLVSTRGHPLLTP